MPRRRLLPVLATALVLLAPAVRAGTPAAPAALDQVQRTDGVLAVPDRFLRAWDPVTVFFPADTGPAQPGPEDHAERYATLSPPVPGAWQWLGPRVLQFRPAEPWTPLRRERLVAGRRSLTLVPLLPAPVQTAPQDQPEGIAGLDTISLTLPGPVDPAALARLLSIELRPLPGIDATGGQTLTATDFDIKPLEQTHRGEAATYLVMLHRPLPDQRLAILRLRLSDEPGLDDPIFSLSLRTATPFTLTGLQCGDGYLAAPADGLTACAPSAASAAAPEQRGVTLGFSAPPATLDILAARNALRLTPPVAELQVTPDSADPSLLHLRGAFQAETDYALRLAPGSLSDQRGRVFAGPARELHFAFRAAPPHLAWDAAQGIVERDGPQMVPARGQGYAHADLRIHRVDPLDRDFWPFPGGGVETSDADSPPLPGNEPATWAAAASIEARGIAERIKALGSPSVSELIALPQSVGGAEAKFGIDLGPRLARIAGPAQPGTYLVGLRPLRGGLRHWMRIEVTDLALSSVEEQGRVRFYVTSLSTARPVPGAEIRVDGVTEGRYRTLAAGLTDDEGAFSFVPDPAAGTAATPRRIVVQKATDTLVLATRPGPDLYAGNGWRPAEGTWLGWSFARKRLAGRAEQPRTLCHVFTERPIYRPEEPVEIRGFVRSYLGGRLSAIPGHVGTVLIEDPAGQQWRYPVTLDASSGFYLHFDAETAATGNYTVSFQPAHGETCDQARFRKEAYRLPTFEVLLNHARQVPLDAPFQVSLLARYYAGGTAVDRPVTWRVTQFPYEWTPPARPGFLFSSDSRFSGEHAFRSTPVLQSQGRTDASGTALLPLDPTVEPTAQPRTYTVEATVTGDDGQQIRSVAEIPALPPFVLGVKMPRYLARSGTIGAELLALDAAGKPAPGLDMTVRLIKRDWTSVLQASDFTQGSAKYATQEVDRTVDERRVASGAAAQAVNFPATEAGVYVLEVTAADRLGRRQTLRVDCFMAGDTPVTWSPPPPSTVTMKTTRPDYAPGESATLLIESPFQTARALVVTEQPDGRFDYAWAEVAHGVGQVTLPVRKEQVPRFAVHVLLMRGRLPGPTPAATAPFDLGKPTTLAATAWVEVRPVENRVTVSFQAPATARPGQTVEIALRLADAGGHPLAGEATFWMVDQAVLALAPEAPLDPLPKFLVSRPARLVARDTRNMAFGVIPLRENPGGSEGTSNPGTPNISVRGKFTPVPIYLPHVKIGPDGVAHLPVKLPDSLTVFMLRAEVTSGPDRFGYAGGRMEIRQPVVAQPVLPRFLRWGDAFDAEVLGRIVEGPGGTGTAVFSADGVVAGGASERQVAWSGATPVHAAFPVSVPEAPSAEVAHLRFLIRRDADQAGDAVQIALPIRPDRPPVRERRLAELGPGRSMAFPAPPAGIRPGSYAGQVAVATDPGLTRTLGALDFLLTYPFGCTEQRIALASSELALLPFGPVAAAEGLGPRVRSDVEATLQAVAQAVDEDGLVGFWPHTRGLVTLTAWSYELMIRVQQAGLPVDAALRDRLGTVLTRSLRSDYPHLLTDAALSERAAALHALAVGGKLDAAYASELARIGGALDTGGLAQVASAIAATPNADRALAAGLLQTLWGRVQLLSRNGQPVYGGITEFESDPLILPSETRSLAEVLGAVAVATPADPRLAILRAGLVQLGGPDGWGSTNANAAALRALAQSWDSGQSPVAVTATLADGAHQATLGPGTPLAAWTETQPGPTQVANQGGRPVVALRTARYVPGPPGWQAEPVQQGLVLNRSLFRVPGGGAPMAVLSTAADGAVHLALGDIVEEAAELVVPEPRSMVAVSLPIAAGLEPLNPALATAPAEAAPSAAPTLAPTYTGFGDDSVLYVYEALPAGTYHFRFRARAGTAGRFTEPPGTAETMYRAGVSAASGGHRLLIGP